MLKVSRYVYECEALLPGLHIVYSSRSGAMIELDDGEWQLARRLLDAPEATAADSEDRQAMQKRLVDTLILVPEDEDEFEAVRGYRQRAKSNPNWLSLTIAPTMQCNFRCTYCFEGV